MSEQDREALGTLAAVTGLISSVVLLVEKVADTTPAERAAAVAAAKHLFDDDLAEKITTAFEAFDGFMKAMPQ